MTVFLLFVIQCDTFAINKNKTVNGMKRTIIVILSAILLWSCESYSDGNRIWHTMNDGTSFYTDGNVYTYNDFEYFLGIVRPSEESSNPATSNAIKWEKDSVYGCDSLVVMKWEKARLGEWAEQYGITSMYTYYITEIKAIKMLPVSPDAFVTSVIYRGGDRDSIGLRESTEGWGFNVSNNYTTKSCREAYTIVKRIEYNELGDKIGIDIPINTINLKWIFKTNNLEW